MSIINQNITNDSTKNDLYNSYVAIKKSKMFDENIKDNLLKDKVSIKKKIFENEVNIMNNDSNKYCLTSSNAFQSKTRIIPILNSSLNSLNLNSSFSKYNKIEIKKFPSSKIKKIKQKILNIREKSLTKNSNIKLYNNFVKKHKTKNYFKEDIKKQKLYKNLTTNNGDIINLNKNKLKELKFRVFQSIQKNYIPLCPHFILAAESINRKIMDYYSSENFKNILKIYKKNFHYKTNIETNPKINKYVNITKINNESSFTKKLNLDKLFNKEEKKLILLEPDYYFKNTNKDCFENINIIKTNKLVEKINKEDLIREELEKKKNKKFYTENNFYNPKRIRDNHLNKTEININNFEEEYIKEYKNNKKSIENLIKKENKLNNEKKIINLENVFEQEIKNGYKKYKYLIYNSKKTKLRKRYKFIDKNGALNMKKNLIENNYKHIRRHEELLKKMNKLDEKGNNNDNLNKSFKRTNKYELNNFTNNKQIEYVKILLNKIKNSYNKND